MAVYTITYSHRAIKEFTDSIAWYKKHSFQASENFKIIVENTIEAIAENPHSFKKTYKKFFVVKVKPFPFSIIYFVEEEDHTVVITSIFHNKRNPIKKFR